MDVDLGSNVTLGSITGADQILSPDGTRLVYVAQGKLWSRTLDQAEALELPATDGAFAPFFSPDGKWVGFFAQGKLKKVAVQGGATVDLCPAPAPRGGSWGEDGSIITTLSVPGALSRIPETGGPPVAVTDLDRDRGEVTHRWPQILPGGKAILFTAHTTTGAYDGADIMAISLSGSPQEEAHLRWHVWTLLARQEWRRLPPLRESGHALRRPIRRRDARNERHAHSDSGEGGL
jgi:serine/threonine-protein kinase